MNVRDKSRRKTLANKFFMDEISLENFSNQAISFLIYSNPKHFEIVFDSISPRIIFKKAKLIKDYFNVTGENNSEYKEKIKSGKLYLTRNQFENYISRKRKSGIDSIF